MSGFDEAPQTAIVEEEGRSASAVSGVESWLLDVDDQLARRDDYIKHDNEKRCPTGFWAIDEALDHGIRPGEVFGLMARPGIGKTLAICNVARQWGERCKDDLHVFFSLEMPAPQVILRLTQLVYNLSKIDAAEAIRSGSLNADEYRRVFKNLFIVDRPGLSTDEMALILKGIEQARKKKVGMISIDYLTIIGGYGGMGRYERASNNAVDCKTLARLFNAAVLLAIQVQRVEGLDDGTKPLGLGSARDSGVIEEAMDYLAALRRKVATGADLGMTLLKNRHGERVNEFTVFFNKRNLELSDRPTYEPTVD